MALSNIVCSSGLYGTCKIDYAGSRITCVHDLRSSSSWRTYPRTVCLFYVMGSRWPACKVCLLSIVSGREQLEVVSGTQTMKFHLAWLGCKGDWVWLRKAFCLRTGFSSARICHMCEQEAGTVCSLPTLYSFQWLIKLIRYIQVRGWVALDSFFVNAVCFGFRV